jgi:hypothetical protein
MNLRVAVEQLTQRLEGIELQDGAEPLAFHSALNRAPVAVPISFTPGPKIGTA